MEECDVIDLFELHYSDLSPSSLSSTKVDSIMEALGANGPGLLAVTGIPNISNFRSYLLPLARKLSLLDRQTRNRILKEHNLGSDVPLKNPHRSVSSFAMQLKYEKTHSEEKDEHRIYGNGFENLGSAFRELGFCMMEVGLCLARICDKAIDGNELEQSLLESNAAKGRLIHYHSHLDAILLQEIDKSKTNNKRGVRNAKPLEGSCLNSIACEPVHSNLWQQWHYESMIMIYDPNKKRVFMVRAPAESFIIQVGESADIISKGKLRSTLHSVHRPSKFENLSRETFVVFLQPAWTKTFSISDYPLGKSAFNGVDGQCFLVDEFHDNDEQQSGQDDNKLSLEIQKIVPPLSSRIKDGMTFAEFSRETTKQYYGGSGLQSNR
ncbi:2-oxoglutarate (2OG) and Fe(II)-dependent oxygenase superfamily protein [Trifolium repens]|nr:2-oxoglutarate (2OG) and Fe(II)-dependent oxygenase superfamily protein [Trifolium repens]